MSAGDIDTGEEKPADTVREPKRPPPGLVAALSGGVAGLVSRLESASSWVRAAVAFVAGALSVLAMAPFFLAPILALTFPALVWLIDTAGAPRVRPGEDTATPPTAGVTLRRAGAAGWYFGFGYFVCGLFWIGEAFLVEAEKFAWLLPAAVTLLPAFLALFFAAAAAAASALWRPGLSRVIVLALAIGCAEWLRGHVLTGLPWNVLGYALTVPGVLMQGASLFGIYGLTLLAVLAFASPLVTLADASRAAERDIRGSALSGTMIAALVLLPLAGFGAWRLATAGDETVPGVRLRIVQPSVPQREKWQREKQRAIFDLHIDLSRRNPRGEPDDLAGITHVVWPEAAMPFLPLESPQAMGEIAEMLPENAVLLTGALRAERPEAGAEGAQAARARVYNTLMVFNTRGGLDAVYDKIHLVPFGEYLPLQSLLESIGLEQLTRLRGGFEAGRSPRPVFDVGGLPPMLALVCYEAIFPAAVVQGEERPGLVVNATNDGWFGKTTGPYQHLHMARVRAVEEGLPLIRAANNGVSAIVDAHGRITETLDLDERGVLDSGLPRSIEPPLYARLGDLVFFVLAALLTAAAMVLTPRTARAR